MFMPWIYQLWKRVAQAGQIAWNQITGVPANLSAIAALTGDGYAKKTGATWSLDAGGGGGASNLDGGAAGTWYGGTTAIDGGVA